MSSVIDWSFHFRLKFAVFASTARPHAHLWGTILLCCLRLSLFTPQKTHFCIVICDPSFRFLRFCIFTLRNTHVCLCHPGSKLAPLRFRSHIWLCRPASTCAFFAIDVLFYLEMRISALPSGLQVLALISVELN